MQHRPPDLTRLTRNACASLVVAGLLAVAQGPSRTATSRFYPDDPHPAGARECGRVRRRRVGHRPVLRPRRTSCSSRRARSPPTRRRATSTRSTRCRTRAGSPTASAAGRSRPMNSSAGRSPDRRRRRRSGRSRARRVPAWRRASPRKDANGETWFVSFDAKANPRGATAAVVISTKIFWALGYNQVEYFVTSFARENTTIDANGHQEASFRQAHADDRRRRA